MFYSKITLKESHVTAEEGLLEGVSYWQTKYPHDVMIAGLRGHLGHSLLSIVKHNLIDDAIKSKPLDRSMVDKLRRKYPGTKPKQEGADYISKEERQTALKHLAYELEVQRESEEEGVEEDDSIALERLELDIDKLTAKELLLLDEVADAANLGYTLNSKRGRSLRQYWLGDYDRKMKMLNRIKVKQKKS